ncbi:hypothetical protein BDZ97DRAFT_1889732 [Flammula alnicola]|nr:hypothetical protein BDZ97DRAFT_1889732 [Flammula alnicola]
MVSTPAKSEPGAQPQDVFQRLVLTLSGRNDPASPLTSPKEPTASPESPSTDYSAPGEPLERVVSSSSSKTKRRLNIGDRLKKLRKDMGKLRKNSDKSVPASPRVTVTEIPPAATSFSPGPSSGPYPGHAKLLSMVAEVDEPVDETLSTRPADPPEATSLAKRIQSLVDSLPFPAPGQNRTIPVVKNPKPPARDADGRPIPPPTPLPSRIPDCSLSCPVDPVFGASSRVSAPLLMDFLPQKKTLLFLVEAENPATVIFRKGKNRLPVHRGRPCGHSLYGTENHPRCTRLLRLFLLVGQAQTARGRVVRVQTVRAWVPSNTKLSVQAMWWGYRLYLPPPVLAILSDKTLEATKRAAMITTALTWFFNHLPVDALPTPVRPAALLLQRLAPYLGYIGTFISWSWSTIKSYDIGYGVILTATWLLPIALIPGTWHERDFPTSPTQGSPAPLPPMSPSSSGSPSLLPTSPPTSPNTSLPTSPSLPPTSTPGSASISLASSSPPPITSPGLSSFSLSPLSPTSPRSNLSRTVPIPVAPLPVDVPPIPPTPTPLEVPLGSPLMAQLLNGPVISTVPLPDEDAEVPQEVVKPRKDRKSRAKALFIRSPKLG